MSRKHLYTVIELAAAAIFLLITWEFKKWTATWFGIPVAIYTLPAMILLAFGLSRLEWWQYPRYSTSGQMVLILIGALILSTILGITLTEPGYAQVRNEGYSYVYADSRVGGWYVSHIDFGGSSSSNSTDSDVDIDLDDAGEGVAYLILIVLAIVVVLASCFVPHFWAFGGVLLITALAMVAYREYMLEE